MGSRSFALFHALLEDLAPELPPSVITAFRSNQKVVDWADITPREAASTALVRAFFKKNVDSVKKNAEEVALAKFLSVNERVGTWCLSLNTSHDELLFGTLKQVLDEFFYPSATTPLLDSDRSILQYFAMGPGAAVGSPGHDFYSKLFTGCLTSTNKGLYRSYRSYISQFPIWLDADDFASSSVDGRTVSIVEGSRLQFVPKNEDIARVICIEPTLNMGFQLGIGHLLEDRLRRFFGIDLALQPDINRELCRRGSLDDSFATIDLESASDSLGLRMLEAVLPRNVLGWLLATRSPSCELPSGSKVKLNMLSTMGNGYTFPLQTALFASVVSACARVRGFHLERPRAQSDSTFGVFGDDIILPTSCHYNRRLGEFTPFGNELVRDVYRLLEILGFRVNADKSFFEGPFRESCGSDYFRGQNTRGVYIKTLRTTQARFVAINTLARWSALNGISLSRTIRFLLRSVPKQYVPLSESDDAGVKVPFSSVPGRFRRDKHTGSILYRAFVPRVRSFSIPEDPVPLGSRKVLYNPSGLLLSFLMGGIRSGRIGIRSNTVLYRSAWRIIPSWDYLHAEPACNAGGRPLLEGLTLVYRRV